MGDQLRAGVQVSGVGQVRANPSMGVTAQAEIPREITLLIQSISMAHTALENLATKLQPVHVPRPEKVSSNTSEERPASSSIGSTIHEQTIQINILIEKIYSLERGIEL